MFFVLIVLFLSTFACANDGPSTVSVTLDSGAQVIGDLAVYNFEGSCQMAITDGELSGTILVFPCRRISFMQQAQPDPQTVEEALDASEESDVDDETLSLIVDLDAMQPAPVDEMGAGEIIDVVAEAETAGLPVISVYPRQSVDDDGDSLGLGNLPVVMAELPDGMSSPASILGL